jgi:hypothetical protein
MQHIATGVFFVIFTKFRFVLNKNNTPRHDGRGGLSHISSLWAVSSRHDRERVNFLFCENAKGNPLQK